MVISLVKSAENYAEILFKIILYFIFIIQKKLIYLQPQKTR